MQSAFYCVQLRSLLQSSGEADPPLARVWLTCVRSANCQCSPVGSIGMRMKVHCRLPIWSAQIRTVYGNLESFAVVSERTCQPSSLCVC
eukprot:5410277-Amphidinium_carterae.2